MTGSAPAIRLREGDDNPNRPPLPTFIIIGAQKCATRWLRFNLGAHPEIFTAAQEVKYFNHPKRIAALGSDWYRDQFEGWADEPITGEATPGYMILRHDPAAVAGRIAELVPDVRLIALLRNPVDRANSALAHHKRAERIHPKTTLLEFIRSQPPEQDWMGIVNGGWYAASLAPYLDRFGDQLLVLLHDEVLADPTAVYERARMHTGATTPFVPADLATELGSSGTETENPIAAADRIAIFDCFDDDIVRLEKVLGRDLSMWRPA